MAWLTSAKWKNFLFRRAARIQRSTNSTPASTLALSRGLARRAGITATPHCVSSLRFVGRSPPPCRYYRHTVVRGHLRVRPIDTRLVAASFGDARLQIVGDDDL